MSQGISITKWRTLETFDNDVKGLPPEMFTAIEDALNKLLVNPKSKKLRFKSVTGSKKPKLFAIHVTPNHSHKISMELDGTVAVLRRFGTHKEIERDP